MSNRLFKLADIFEEKLSVASVGSPLADFSQALADLDAATSSLEEKAMSDGFSEERLLKITAAIDAFTKIIRRL